VKRIEKEELVKELREAFQNHDSFYLVDFIKMSVSQFVELRKIFRENAYTFKVVKNRLALRALDDDVHGELKKHFQGTTAVAFALQNPLDLARILKEFSERHKVLNFKAGLLQGQYLPQDRFKEVAMLNSREELVAKMGFLMASQLIKLLRTWQAPLASLGSLLSQLKSKK
jgi:large subunit ribosomal protein L10